MPTTPVLHIYAQSENHDEAYIVGTLAGLSALRSAIDAAIATGQGDAYPFVADGEGFRLTVVSQKTWDDMRALQYPYTDRVTSDGMVKTWLVGGDTHPCKIVK